MADNTGCDAGKCYPGCETWPYCGNRYAAFCNGITGEHLIIESPQSAPDAAFLPTPTPEHPWVFGWWGDNRSELESQMPVICCQVAGKGVDCFQQGEPPQVYCLWCHSDGNYVILQTGITPVGDGWTMNMCNADFAALQELAAENCKAPLPAYCLWCRSDGSYQIRPAGEPSPGPDYTKNMCGTDLEGIQQVAAEACQPEPSPTECCIDTRPALNAIKGAIDDLSKALDDKLKSGCSKLDDCIDYIIAKIDAKFKGVKKTCQQCKAAVEAGLDGTLEYAITCAGKCCGDCKKEIECKSGTDDGKPCTTCGKEPCCCESGKCVPCPDKDKDQGEWCGWCDYSTGLYVVLKRDDLPPGPNYRKIICGDDAVAVHIATNAECEKTGTAPPPVSDPTFPKFPQPHCKLDIYSSPGGMAQLFDESKAIAINSAILQSGEKLAQSTLARLLGYTPLGQAIGMGYDQLTAPWAIATMMAPALASVLGSDSVQWKAGLLVQTAIGFIESKCGVNLSEWKEPLRYAMNSVSRQKYHGISGAVSAFLSDAIDYNKCDTLAGMDGFCREALDWQIHSSRSKPIPHELAFMRRRSIISPSDYEKGMRELGYLEPKVRSNLFKLTEQPPTYSDIVRMMVRDADDNHIAETFGLDTDFDKKFQSQLKEWTEWQGIPEKAMKYIWRAHWAIPSPTQLFEFWHRLRYKPEFGGKDKLEQDIKDALIQQDILPYWHKHYLEVSFRPLTRVDVRRGFDIGTMDREEVRKSYLDGGYSDENAERLTKFAEKLRQRGARTHWAIKLWLQQLITRDEANNKMVADGLPTDVARNALDFAEYGFIRSPIAVALKRGDLSREQADKALTDLGVSPAAIEKIIATVSLAVTSTPAIKAFRAGRISRQEAIESSIRHGMAPAVAEKNVDEASDAMADKMHDICQRGIRRRFKLGEFDHEQALQQLLDFGFDKVYASMAVAGWVCERKAIGKHVPASVLCRWLEQGAIQPADFVARLQRIGYDATDAALMVADCLQSISVKRMKQAEREMKENAAAQRRAQQEAARQMARAKADAEKLKRMKEKAEVTKRNREIQLTRAAEKLADRCQCEIYLAMEAIKIAKSRLQSQYGFGIDEALAILLVASEGWDGGMLSDFQSHVDVIAGGAGTIEIEDVGEVSIDSLSDRGTT